MSVALSATLYLRDLSLDMRIGAYAKERGHTQQVLVNLEVETLLSADFSDDLGEVTDYDALRRAVTELALSRHFDLQETLCREILAVCASFPSVIAAAVETEKVEAHQDMHGAACRMRWQRQMESAHG